MSNPEEPPEQTYKQRHAYAQALADATCAAAQLGVALAHFHNTTNALAAVTPKCQCGWAEGHRGNHKGGTRT